MGVDVVELGNGFVRSGCTELNEHYGSASFRGSSESELSVACVARQTSATPFRTERESFPIYVLEHVVSGEGFFESEGGRIVLSPGVIFVYGGSAPHCYGCDAAVPFERYYVGLAGCRSRKMLMDCLGTASGVVELAEAADVRNCCESILQTARVNGEYSEEIAVNHARNLLLHIKRSRVRPGEGRSLSAPELAFLRAMKEIDDNFLEINTLAELAGRLGLSEHYLCRLFKRFHAQTPYQRLLARKITCASTLLLTGSIPIKEIAEQLGFEDVYTFSRVFKRVAGEPPGRFRANSNSTSN